ncbi:MAG: hypothetical protein ACTHMG_03800 [Sphingomonas sp.]
MANSNDRAQTARDHDDSAIIDGATEAPDKVGREGGNLQRDVGTQDELDRVSDPDNTERVTKSDDIANNDAYPSNRGRG